MPTQPVPTQPMPPAAIAAPGNAVSPSRPRGLAHILLIGYVVALALIAFWPVPVDRGAGAFLRVITHWVPALTYGRIEFAANIVLFVPFGLLLTLILDRARWLVLPIAVVTTVTIECVQGVLLHARTPSVLDIVANTTGACIGILLAVGGEALRGRTRRHVAEH